MPSHPPGEEPFPNIQPKPPLRQLPRVLSAEKVIFRHFIHTVYIFTAIFILHPISRRCEKRQDSSGLVLGKGQIPAGCGGQGAAPATSPARPPGTGAVSQRNKRSRKGSRPQVLWHLADTVCPSAHPRFQPPPPAVRSRAPGHPPRRPPHLPCRSTARRRRPRAPGSMARTPPRTRAARAAAGRPRPPPCPWPPPGPPPSRGGAAAPPAPAEAPARRAVPEPPSLAMAGAGSGRCQCGESGHAEPQNRLPAHKESLPNSRNNPLFYTPCRT